MSIGGSLSRAIIEEIDVRRATDDPKVGEGHAVIPEGQSSNAGADSHKTPTPGVFFFKCGTNKTIFRFRLQTFECIAMIPLVIFLKKSI